METEETQPASHGLPYLTGKKPRARGTQSSSGTEMWAAPRLAPRMASRLCAPLAHLCSVMRFHLTPDSSRPTVGVRGQLCRQSLFPLWALPPGGQGEAHDGDLWQLRVSPGFPVWAGRLRSGVPMLSSESLPGGPCSHSVQDCGCYVTECGQGGGHIQEEADVAGSGPSAACPFPQNLCCFLLCPQLVKARQSGPSA